MFHCRLFLSRCQFRRISKVQGCKKYGGTDSRADSVESLDNNPANFYKKNPYCGGFPATIEPKGKKRKRLYF